MSGGGNRSVWVLCHGCNEIMKNKFTGECIVCDQRKPDDRHDGED